MDKDKRERKARQEMVAEERGTGRLPAPASVLDVLPEYRNPVTVQLTIESIETAIADAEGTLADMKRAPEHGVPQWAVDDVVRHTEQLLKSARGSLRRARAELRKISVANERRNWAFNPKSASR